MGVFLTPSAAVLLHYVEIGGTTRTMPLATVQMVKCSLLMCRVLAADQISGSTRRGLHIVAHALEIT